MNINHNVLIIGAGPIGCATACLIKALNPRHVVNLIDRKPIPTNHLGIDIDSDSIAKVEELIKDFLNTKSEPHQLLHLKDLLLIFKQWKGSLIRTSKIVEILNAKALQMGISVWRDRTCTITEDNFDAFFEPSTRELNPSQKKLKKMFQEADILIGADGANSVVRNKVIGKLLLDEKVMQHVIEFKCQIKRNPPIPKNSVIPHQTTRPEIKNDNPQKNKKDKSVALHIFVDQTVYDRFKKIDSSGHIKGISGNPWSLMEIQHLAKTDPIVNDIYERKIRPYLDNNKQRNGGCFNEALTVLEHKTGRSQTSVKRYKGKLVMLIGDAYSKMVKRGCNKGLKEAALCAHTLHQYFTTPPSNAEIPPEFVSYDQKITKIYQDERWWAEYNNSWLSAALLTLNFAVSKIRLGGS